jgi:hypothetical protein
MFSFIDILLLLCYVCNHTAHCLQRIFSSTKFTFIEANITVLNEQLPLHTPYISHYPSQTVFMMSSISNWHLFCLILMASSFSFSGLLGRTNAAPALGLSDFGVSTVSSLLASMGLASSAVTTGSSLSPSSIVSSVTPPSQTQNIIVSSSNGLSPPYPTASSTATSLLSYETPNWSWEPKYADIGKEYGNATIISQCEDVIYAWTVGAHRLGGIRDKTTGFGSLEDTVMYTIGPGENYTEYLHITPLAANSCKGYAYDWDKQYGHGVSIKSSYTQEPAGNVSQFEYALSNNSQNDHTYYEIYYDASYIDCGALLNVATTDFTATDADYAAKVRWCPGYQGGVSITFESDVVDTGVCEEVYCENECRDVYMFDRSREMKPSKSVRAS